MWYPIKLKSDPRLHRGNPAAGWYCFDDISRSADPLTRHSRKQSAHNACNRLNKVEAAKSADGLTRNAKRWYSVGYVDEVGNLVVEPFHNNPSHYYGYLGELLRRTKTIMEDGYITGAVVAVIWPEQDHTVGGDRMAPRPFR